jgi:hypothetical protein
MLAACAGDLADIDRTQPAKIRKDSLAGEWYFRQTVVGVPYASSVTFVGEQSALERVRFDISESYLTAIRTYQWVDGTHYEGAPIAAFRILKHFDVVRDYDPATLEQGNLLEENDFDRPWYERDYMRVDWSENLVGNFAFLAAGATGLGVVTQSASYAVTDPFHPDAPVFATRSGDAWADRREPAGPVDYFDITVKLSVEPTSFELEYDDGSAESVPACWYYEVGPYDCASETVKIRAAFLRVLERSYVPLDYPDNRILQDSDGAPVWVGYDDAGNRVRCGAGSYDGCEVARMPMFDRFGYFRTEREAYTRGYELTESGRSYLINRHDPRAPVVFYLSADFPTALEAAASEVGAWWDAAVRGAGARGLELRRNSGQRNGDLRYNQLHWLQEPTLEAFLGYVTSGADPLTGEIIAADAYVYGAQLDAYTTRAADTIDLMRGEIAPEEFIRGENVARHLQRMGDASSAESMRRRIERAQLQGRVEQIRALGPRAFSRQRDFVEARLRRGGDVGHDELDRVGRTMAPLHRRRLREQLREHRRHVGKHAVDFVDFADLSVSHLLREFQGVGRDEMLAALRSYLFKSVAAHEVGHALGLRHNFAASADALNYHDDYWAIRGAQFGPLDLPTAAEQAQGLREYSYSSVMDYGASFLTDIRGLGKYDVAAIKFGYGERVEVFTQPVTHPLLDVVDLEDLRDWIHYSEWQRQAGAGRYDVPLTDVEAWLALRPGAPALTNRVVPYRFCSDEYDGALWDCASYDEGADPYEIVHYAGQRYRDYYVFDAFKRDRRYLDPWEYYERVYWRTMAPMALQYQMWVYDQWWKSDLWATLYEIGYSDTSDWNDGAGLAATAASVAALDFLAEVLATPEPGSYGKIQSDDAVLSWMGPAQETPCTDGEDSSQVYCADAFVAVGEGRYALSEFDADSGYYWYERMRVVGSFWDKLAAIETLADPTTTFLGVDDTGDSTRYMLGFNAAFPDEVHTLLGAIVSDDYAAYARGVEDDSSFLDRFHGAATPPLLLDPATNFTVSLFALWYGMALLPANFDMGFNDAAKIWLEGSGEAVTPVDDSRVITFDNPFNDRRYLTLALNDYGLGQKLLTKANREKSALERCTSDCAYAQYLLQTTVETIELVRGYYDLFGLSVW